MIIYVNGSGASEGTPLYGFPNANEEAVYWSFERRKPSSFVYISRKKATLLIDAGSNPFENIYTKPDAILLTHWHSDHTQALFSIRWINEKIKLYAPEPKKEREIVRQPINLEINFVEPFEKLTIKDFEIIPVPLNHSVPTLGYVISDGLNTVFHLSDTKGLPTSTRLFLEKVGVADVIITDGTFATIPGKEFKAGNNHNDLSNILEIAKLGRKTVIVHLPPYSPTILELHSLLRDMGIENVIVGYDGMVIQP